MGNPDRMPGVGAGVPESYRVPRVAPDRETGMSGRKPQGPGRGLWILRPFRGESPHWEDQRRAAVPRLRRAALFAIAVHIAAALAFVIVSQPRPVAPLGGRGIPVHLVSVTTPPPSLRARPQAAQTQIAPPRKQQPPKPKETAKPRIVPEKKSATPVPKRDAPRDPVRAGQQDRSAADSLRALRTEIPLAGGGLGALEITGSGPLAPYSYYLQVVRDKIASYWEPPAGLAVGGREIAMVVTFQIDRRGAIQSSYVSEPSGSGVFDAAGVRAVTRANPLPPLPQEFAGQGIGIHLRFVYQD